MITNLITQVVTRNNPIFEPTATATLLRGVPYSWHVVSYGTDVSLTATSNTWRFYLAGEGIANYAPFPPQIVEPASGATISPNDDGNIVLSWQAEDVDNDPLIFTVFVDTVDGFQEPLPALSNIENTTVEVAVIADEVYFWRVKVHDGHHETTSPIYTFRTQ